MKRIKAIYEYRAMISSLIRRELRGRYKGSVLGFAWTFLNPLLQLAVYTVVFSQIMRAGVEDYYLFLFVVLVPWMFFSASLTGGASCIVAQKDMVQKIYFPREVLPISYVTGQLVNMFYSFIVVIAVLIVSGKGISLRAIAYLPIIIVVEYLLAIGIALLASACTVYLRDLEHILAIFSMAWQFLSPVMYSVDMVPERFQKIFMMNPMTPICIAYRDILYYKQAPQLSTLLSAVFLGVLLLVIGWFVFGKLQRRFAEEL